MSVVPTTNCVQKTIVVKPGDTVVLPRRVQVTQTILENDAQVSTLCENFLTNIRNEDRNEYAFYIEFVSELAGFDGSSLQTLDGISINGQEYPFGEKLPFKATGDASIARALNNTNSQGPDFIYDAIINAVPDGNILFTKMGTSAEFWRGPSTDSTRDDVWYLQLTVGSFSSIMGNDGRKVYLYGTDGAKANFNIPDFRTVYYAIPKS